MNYSIQKFEMPYLNINQDELEKIILNLLSHTNNSLDFNSFTQILANHLLKENIGFLVEANTSYSGNMQQKDENIVREIIWDLIILRYLTPGGNGYNCWPNLTITSRGATFFNKFK